MDLTSVDFTFQVILRLILVQEMLRFPTDAYNRREKCGFFFLSLYMQCTNVCDCNLDVAVSCINLRTIFEHHVMLSCDSMTPLGALPSSSAEYTIEQH